MNPTPATRSTRLRTVVPVVGSIALALLIIGGLNWALVGLFNLDLVATVFGSMSLLSRVVYLMVGLAALYALALLPRLTRLGSDAGMASRSHEGPQGEYR